MNIGHIADHYLPPVIGNRLHVLKDTWKLRSIPRLKYDVTRLRAASSLDITALMRSAAAHDAWRKVEAGLHELDIPDGTGGVNPGDRRAVFYLAHALRPHAVLEIGTHIGASTVHIAAALAHNRREGLDDGHLVTVDVADVNSTATRQWLRYGARHSPREALEQLGLADQVTFVNQPSLEFAKQCGRRFDLIFLDGDHAAETVYREVAAALKMLNEGGVILLHDYFPNLKPLWRNGTVVTGPYMATERLRREGVNVTVMPLGALPWCTKFGSRYTSLALLLADR